MDLEILSYFEYRDNDLFISSKWSGCCTIGKRVGKVANINDSQIKKELIIWAKINGLPPENQVVKLREKNNYSIDNLYLEDYKYSNGRPRGSVDKIKRRRKKVLTHIEERFIKNNWGKYGIKYFAKHFNVSNSAIVAVKDRLKLETKTSIANSIKGKMEINKIGKISGIYAIITEDGRAYIGSSSNMRKRLLSHISDLNQGKHINKSLQRSYGPNTYLAIIEECDERNLLDRENYHIKNTSKIHNMTKINYYDPEIYSEAYKKIMENLTILGNGCWEYNRVKVHKSGYKAVIVNKIDIWSHRVMFYYNNPDVSQNMVVRHKCGNKVCCNPEHLTYGSYRENSIDNKLLEMEKFDKRYRETGGDKNILIEEFGIELKTVQSRIYSRGLVKASKHAGLQKSEV